MNGAWRTAFNGYGSVAPVEDGSRVLQLAPRSPQTPDETHAALVTSSISFGDFEATMRVKTARQLRAANPNPWEAAWVLWRYTGNTSFYYLVLKPNGWEIGKEDPAYPGAQRFLATGTDRTFPPGQWHEVKVRMAGDTMTLWIDGLPLAELTDTERPYHSGALGLYTEDAEARFDDVAARGV